MIVIPGLSQPLNATGMRVTSWVEESNGLMVEARSTVRRAACPRCSTRSSRLHGHYRRAIADSPCFGRPVTLAVEIRRFKCINDCCAQRTFCECIEPLAATRQRRTLRLMQGVQALGYALGGQADARLAGQLGMPVSGSTVLREPRRLPAPTGSCHRHRRLRARLRPPLRHDRGGPGETLSDRPAGRAGCANGGFLVEGAGEPRRHCARRCQRRRGRGRGAYRRARRPTGCRPLATADICRATCAM